MATSMLKPLYLDFKKTFYTNKKRNKCNPYLRWGSLTAFLVVQCWWLNVIFMAIKLISYFSLNKVLLNASPLSFSALPLLFSASTCSLTPANRPSTFKSPFNAAPSSFSTYLFPFVSPISHIRAYYYHFYTFLSPLNASLSCFSTASSFFTATPLLFNAFLSPCITF